MKKKKTLEEMINSISQLLDKKKAENILQVDVKERTTLCDYFIFASAKNSVQVRALCEALEEEMAKKYQIKPRRREGVVEGQWSVLDYGDIIVHIFLEEMRTFYNLDALWVDANNTINFSLIAEKIALEKKQERLQKMQQTKEKNREKEEQ